MKMFILLAALFFFIELLLLMINYTKSKSINLAIGATIALILTFIGWKITYYFYEIPILLFYKYIIAPSFLLAFSLGLLAKSRSGDNPANETKFKFVLETESGKIEFFDPFNNFLIYGGQGSGKTLGIGKPLLREYIKNNFAGFIYDLKDEDYTKTAYYLINENPNYPYKFYYVNFRDMSKTYRFNPLSRTAVPNGDMTPQLVTDLLEAYLSKDHDKNEWYLAGLGILKGVSVRFYNEFPQYCTIPHIFNFCLHNDKKVIEKFINEDYQARAFAGAFIGASGSERTQAGYLSSLTGLLGDVAGNKNICYVLSGSDFEFNLIDPKEPKLFAISNSFGLQDLLSPLIALLLKISSRQFTNQNKIPFVYNLDEATTFKIADFENLPSVLREYKASFTFITQSSSKITSRYGREALSSIESNFVNVFLGRTKDIVALENYPKLFSKKRERKDSFSRSSGTNSSSSGQTYRIERVLKYESEDFTNLAPGQFIGTSNSNMKEFHVRFKPFQQPPNVELPMVRPVSTNEVEENYYNIINTVKSMI